MGRGPFGGSKPASLHQNKEGIMNTHPFCWYLIWEKRDGESLKRLQLGPQSRCELFPILPSSPVSSSPQLTFVSLVSCSSRRRTSGWVSSPSTSHLLLPCFQRVASINLEGGAQEEDRQEKDFLVTVSVFRGDFLQKVFRVSPRSAVLNPPEAVTV